MLLSEAILLGSTLKPQVIGLMVTKDGRSCALGAALDAIGKLDIDGQYVTPLYEHWPWMAARPDCPICVGGEHSYFTVGGIVAHLNDFHRLTRERIAEWVASIEPKDEKVEPVEASLEVQNVLDEKCV